MSLICHQQRTRQELVMSDRKLIYTMDKLFHSFSLPYVQKLTASQTKIFVLLLNQEGHNNLRKLCYTRHKFVSQIIHAFHSLVTREI